MTTGFVIAYLAGLVFVGIFICDTNWHPREFYRDNETNFGKTLFGWIALLMPGFIIGALLTAFVEDKINFKNKSKEYKTLFIVHDAYDFLFNENWIYFMPVILSLLVFIL